MGTHLSRKHKLPVGPTSKMFETSGSRSNPAEGALGAELETVVGDSGRTSSAPFPRGAGLVFLSLSC